MKILKTETNDSLFETLSEHLLISSGKQKADHLEKLITVARNGAAWKTLTDNERANLSFQMEMLSKLLKQLDNHTDSIHTSATSQNEISNFKQLQYA